ncbi:beta-glucosidase [Geofilum rubicundum JCM 15548]|uniref:Beta-glucosidase n=1 Tax=Geofilum rubicundum JCM 15548 TaxID=1236989 RepID=A0A0E9LVJ8_9BACT|nr:beta-glucosidase [Geofilum rubicundum JCM 15548]
MAFTNHPGIIDYKGKAYFFYHTHALSGGEGFKRSVSLEQFEYNADGTIPMLLPTQEGVKESVAALNPYKRVEAETIAWSEGLKTKSDHEVGIYVTHIQNGDFLKVRSVDFGQGARRFSASVASVSKGGSIEIRLGAVDGTLLGVCEVENTGGWQNWKTVSSKIKKTKGVHDVYLVFKGSEDQLFNFDWWQFVDAQSFPFQNPDLSSEERAKDLISRLTVEEKAALLCDQSEAIPRLGIDRFNWWSEALHGYANNDDVTVFPQPIGMAASFNDELLFRIFDATSDEARALYHESQRRGEENRRF